MVQNRQVTLLGDSILKGIQVDLGDRRYRTHNEINVEALESEFQLSIHNDAHFGATVRKGSRLLDRMLARKLPCDMMVMDFGGNDCDFRWKEIAEDPTGDHQPNVPLPEFVELYREMIRRARSHGIRPILTNLPPLDSERFFNWWCGCDALAGRRGQHLRLAGAVFPCGGTSGPGGKCAAGGCPRSLFGLRPSGADSLRRWYPPQHRRSGLDHKGVSGFWPWTAAGRSDCLTNEQKYGPVLKTDPYFL